MDLLKSVKQRSVLSEIIYVGLNLALAIAIFVAVWAFESPLIALVIMLLSKWRIFAVRPRYWLANIQANMVDIIVGFSVVGLLYFSGSLGAQIVITLLYMAWLILLKPRSKRIYMVLQAFIAGLGIIVLYNVAYEWPSSLVVLAMFIIGYSSARHILTAYGEKQLTFMSLVWGLVVAQLGWLAYHWSIAYELPGSGGLLLPQVAIVVLFIGFIFERAYASAEENNGEVKFGDILLPAALGLAVIAVLEFGFNSIGTGAI